MAIFSIGLTNREQLATFRLVSFSWNFNLYFLDKVKSVSIPSDNLDHTDTANVLSPLKRGGIFDDDLALKKRRDAYDYEGELDENGRICGYGKMVKCNDRATVLTGTFFNNLPHGLIEIKTRTGIEFSEFQCG